MVRSAILSGSCIALSYDGNCGTEEAGSFLIWHDLDVVIPWGFLFGVLTPWFVVGDRRIPNCPFFRRTHMSVVRSLFNVKHGKINIGSLRGGGVVRRDSGSFQFP